MNRASMVKLPQLCSKVVHDSGLTGTRLLFRKPAAVMKPEERLKEVMLDLPPAGEHWSTDYESLRPHLPEMQEAVVLAWLCLDQSQKNWDDSPERNGWMPPQRWQAPARVLARGMERVMDLGALQGLIGTFVGNILWLRHR